MRARVHVNEAMAGARVTIANACMVPGGRYAELLHTAERAGSGGLPVLAGRVGRQGGHGVRVVRDVHHLLRDILAAGKCQGLSRLV